MSHHGFGFNLIFGRILLQRSDISVEKFIVLSKTTNIEFCSLLTISLPLLFENKEKQKSV